jgi:diaminopimelate decarboxylase
MDPALLTALAAEHGTPLYVLDLDRVRAQLAKLERVGVFDRVRYAQKANSGLALLRALREAGVHVDAISAVELERARLAGFAADQIEVCSDVLDRATLERAAALGVRCNLGSADLIEPYAAAGGNRECTLRLNPGYGVGHDRRVTTGGPHSKHGIWHADLAEALDRCADAGLRVTGFHMHIGSGAELEGLQSTIDGMGAALELAPATLERVSAGGGLSIPYRPGEPEFPVERYAEAWGAARERWSAQLGRRLELEVEPGRFLVGPAGVLVTEVRAVKRTSAWNWVLVDAGFQTLARPVLYGAYHHIEALAPRSDERFDQVVAGPLCESGDVFTQDKQGVPAPVPLPPLAPGDLLTLGDAGAYGLSMASNYNGFPLPPEVLVEGGEPRLVRRRQTAADLLAPELDVNA